MTRQMKGAVASSFLTVMAVTAAIVGNPFGGGPFSPSGGGGGAVDPEDVLAIVADAGTLATADKDLHANTFVANSLAADGGAGNYAFVASGSAPIWKMGPGSQNELRATSNRIDHEVALEVFQTTWWNQTGCKQGQNCALYADPGKWIRHIPTNDLSGCDASTEGGVRVRDFDGRPVSCDGTAVRDIAWRASWSAAADFNSFANTGCQWNTFTATGAVLDEPVAVGGCGSVTMADADLICAGSVTATNQATIRVCCLDTLGCTDLPSITFTLAALR